MSRFVSLSAAMLLAASLVGPAKVEAQGSWLSSTMTAACVTLDCTQVQFVLDMSPDMFVDWVRIRSFDNTVWSFDRLLEVRDRNGNQVDWDPWVDSQEITLKAGGSLVPEPIYITASMSMTSTSLAQVFEYAATGSRVLDGGTQWDTWWVSGTVNTTVAPEPMSVVLLGLGLAGMAAARRRRRQSFNVSV